jgi:hypothetical protein
VWLKRGIMNGRLALVLGSLISSVCANEIAVSQPKQEYKDKHPVHCSYDCDLFRKHKKCIFTDIEALYWTVNEGALDYAIKMKKPADDPTDAVGHYKTADFHWDPGFRVSLGYYNAPHYWDAQIQYTYFTCKGSDDVHAPKGAGLFLNGTWPHPNTTASPIPPLKHARSDIELRMNLLGLHATRRFHPNPHLRMRLYGGADIAWLRQNWEIDYRDVDGAKSHLHNQWHFTGAGIRLGLLLDWFLGKGGIYFTGLLSAACFAGDFHNVSKQKSSLLPLPFRNAHYHDTRLVPQFQVSAGPSWQQVYGNIRTEIFLGYELNIWSNLHEVIRTNSAGPTEPKQTSIDTGLVGIQGVTLRWNLDF